MNYTLFQFQHFVNSAHRLHSVRKLDMIMAARSAWMEGDDFKQMCEGIVKDAS